MPPKRGVGDTLPVQWVNRLAYLTPGGKLFLMTSAGGGGSGFQAVAPRRRTMPDCAPRSKWMPAARGNMERHRWRNTLSPQFDANRKETAMIKKLTMLVFVLVFAACASAGKPIDKTHMD